MPETVNRNYKDRLFRLVFREKKDLLDLYNAIRGTNYTDTEALEITTLEDVVYMKMKNDVSFLIHNILNLYEHQSTFNPNMALRGLLYLSDEYRRYIATEELNLYSSKLMRIPMPQYFIFYNGLREVEERTVLPLSDAFINQDAKGESCLEFKAIMLNINYGHNKELMEQCVKLKHYAQFVAKIREYLAQGLGIGEAARQAVDDCIKNGILAEILSANRAEVLNLVLTEYDEESHIAGEKEISYEEGYDKGYDKGESRMANLCVKMQEDGRLEEYSKAVLDKEYLHRLYQEYDL